MAFSVALSGLKGSSSQLEITGNNIANVAVAGFKKSFGDFVDVYSSASGSNSSTGKGSRLAGVKQSFSQGAVNTSEGALDMAINGGGFFIVKDSGNSLYTRAGSFGLDRSGYVVNGLGHRLQGYQADATGAISGALGDVVISTPTVSPSATTTFSSSFNLNSSNTVPTSAWAGTPAFGGTPPEASTYNSAISTTIFDSLGNSHVLTGYLLKTTTANNWNAHFQVDGVNVSTSAAKNNALTSTASNLLTAGSLPAISAGDLTINGTSVAAPLTDGVSSSQPTRSAIAIATAINLAAPAGVTATVNANTLNLGTFTAGVLAGAQFQINGSNIVVGTATQGALLTAINGVTGATGVTAAADGSNNIILTAADGRNIQVTSAGTSLTGTFTGFALTSAGDSVKRGTVSLASTAPFVIAGNAPTNTGFIANTYLAPWNLVFKSDGTLDTAASDTIALSWAPLDSTGASNGSTSPQAISINLDSATQYGADFSVQSLVQDGYTSGRLSSISINGDGTIFGSYTNGNSLSLARVALASFQNEQGLTPAGNTGWSESFSSGSPVVGSPGTSKLGTVQSSSLEDSNVNLTQELVALILAQRNFQANVQTITTSNATTQALFNIR